MLLVTVAGAIAQPTRHPVTEYVFEIEFIVMVRSFIPGREAMEMCLLPSYKICSYISSVTAKASHFWHRCAISIISCLVKTFPVGLFGVFIMMALVLLL